MKFYKPYGFDFSMLEEKYKDNYRLWNIKEYMDPKQRENMWNQVRSLCTDDKDFLEQGHFKYLKILKDMFPNFSEL